MITKKLFDKNGNSVNVGNNVMRDQRIETIIRIDTNTEQVWYKNGGFNWFEEMKNFIQIAA